MPEWTPKDTPKNRRMADRIARYYYAYFNFMGRKPTNKTIGIRFGHSEPWGRTYLNFAWGLRFIRHETMVEH
jgi:hypothetical protein